MSGRLGARRRARVTAVGVTMLIGAALFAAFGPNASASVNVDCPASFVELKIDSDPIAGLAVGESNDFTVEGYDFTITKVLGAAPFQNDSFDWVSHDLAIGYVYVNRVWWVIPMMLLLAVAALLIVVGQVAAPLTLYTMF